MEMAEKCLKPLSCEEKRMLETQTRTRCLLNQKYCPLWDDEAAMREFQAKLQMAHKCLRVNCIETPGPVHKNRFLARAQTQTQAQAVSKHQLPTWNRTQSLLYQKYDPRTKDKRNTPFQDGLCISGKCLYEAQTPQPLSKDLPSRDKQRLSGCELEAKSKTQRRRYQKQSHSIKDKVIQNDLHIAGKCLHKDQMKTPRPACKCLSQNKDLSYHENLAHSKDFKNKDFSFNDYLTDEYVTNEYLSKKYLTNKYLTKERLTNKYLTYEDLSFNEDLTNYEEFFFNEDLTNEDFSFNEDLTDNEEFFFNEDLTNNEDFKNNEGLTNDEDLTHKEDLTNDEDLTHKEAMTNNAGIFHKYLPCRQTQGVSESEEEAQNQRQCLQDQYCDLTMEEDQTPQTPRPVLRSEGKRPLSVRKLKTRNWRKFMQEWKFDPRSDRIGKFECGKLVFIKSPVHGENDLAWLDYIYVIKRQGYVSIRRCKSKIVAALCQPRIPVEIQVKERTRKQILAEAETLRVACHFNNLYRQRDDLDRSRFEEKLHQQHKLLDKSQKERERTFFFLQTFYITWQWIAKANACLEQQWTVKKRPPRRIKSKFIKVRMKRKHKTCPSLFPPALLRRALKQFE